MTGAVTGWVTMAVKRYLFCQRVKRLCKKKAFVLKKNGLLWWSGKNKSGKCNFTVICKDESYCVKLVGVRSKRILYGFIDENYYEIKDYTFALAHTMDSFEYVVKQKEPYRFEKKTKPCIVMIPDSVKVTVRSETAQMQRVEIGTHDKTPEGEFYFAEKFLSELKEK